MDTLLFMGGFILAFGLVSARLENTPVTPPMLFVSLGILLGPVGLGWIALDTSSRVIHILAEATLVLVLFTDASRIDLKVLKASLGLPARLLGLGMPLTILLGALAAVILLPELGLWEAAAVAAILAPTDAALGQIVVSSRRVPVRIRQSLNVESGLNDGLVLPVILIFLSLAGAAEGALSSAYWLEYGARQLLLGPMVGAAVGFFGGRAVQWGTRSGWMNDSFQRLAALALALLSFAGAELVGGNGFIAAFCAGIAVGNSARAVCPCLFEFAEAEGQLLTLLAFMGFGAADISGAVLFSSPWAILYSVLSLTLIRMLPVSISLLGAGLSLPSHLFLGWFGPRGLASILYTFLILERMDLEGKDQMFDVVVATVVLSVLAHGLTAAPGVRLYAQHVARRLDERPDCAEAAPAPELPTRQRLRSQTES